MKSALILIFICLSTVSWAEEEKTASSEPNDYFDMLVRPNRKSYLGLVFGAGDFQYSYSGLNGGIGIGKNWRINLAANTYKNERDASTRDFRGGADFFITDSISAKFGIITKNEPNDIRGTGAHIGGDWVLSDLWKGDWQTILFLEMEGVTYQQYRSDRRLVAEGEKLKQNMLLIGSSQELWHMFMITLTVTHYGYDGKDPDLWALAVAERRAAPDGSFGLIKGFQKNSTGVQIQWFATDWLTVEIGGSTVYSTLNETTRVSYIGANIFINPHWSFDFNGSVSATDYQRDGGVIGTGVKYYF